LNKRFSTPGSLMHEEKRSRKKIERKRRLLRFWSILCLFNFSWCI
jgi:hypothetical protein